jgi:hypothetical protein
MKARPSTPDGEAPRAPAAPPSEPGLGTDGSASMSTMAVLRAAQVDTKGRRVATLVGALVAVLGVAAAVFVFVIRPKMIGSQPPPKTVTINVAPTDTFAADVPAAPTTTSASSPTPAVDAGASSTALASTTPVRPRTGDRPTATSPKHTGGRPGTKPTSDTPPTTTTVAPPKPTGDFTDFGNRK